MSELKESVTLPMLSKQNGNWAIWVREIKAHLGERGCHRFASSAAVAHTQLNAEFDAIMALRTAPPDESDAERAERTKRVEAYDKQYYSAQRILMQCAEAEIKHAVLAERPWLIWAGYEQLCAPRVVAGYQMAVHEELTNIKMTPGESALAWRTRLVALFTKYEQAHTANAAAPFQLQDTQKVAYHRRGLDKTSAIWVAFGMNTTAYAGSFDDFCKLAEQHELYASHLLPNAGASGGAPSGKNVKASEGFALITGAPGSKKFTGTCSACGTAGHKAADCRKRDKLTCNFCKKKGHSESVCRAKKRVEGQNSGGGASSSGSGGSGATAGFMWSWMIAEMHESVRELGATLAPENDISAAPTTDSASPQLYASAAAAATATDTAPSNSCWYLDTGASRHVCGERSLLSNVHKLDKPVMVTLADGKQAELDEVGDVLLETPYGLHKLSDVLLRENSGINLISASRLLARGVKLSVSKSAAIVREHKRKIVMKFRPSDRLQGLFALDGKAVPAAPGSSAASSSTAAAASSTVPSNFVNELAALFTPTEAKLWHERLAHVNADALQHMHDDGIVLGLKGGKHVDACDICRQAKATRERFGKKLNRPRAEKAFQRVHADIIGPIRTEAFGGVRYVLSIVDEATDCTWSYLLQLKSQAEAHIRAWHAHVKTQYNAQVKEFHTDHGGEFTSNSLLAYWAEHGVRASTVPRGTPQYNGIAERKNRTLIEATRALLIRARLPARFWGLAFLTMVYIHNRTVRGRSRTMTPFEAMEGYKPVLSHVRVFGCDAWVHDQDPAGKLAPRATPMVFVGYDALRMAYKFFNPAAAGGRGAFYVSRDAKFDEASFKIGRSAVSTAQVEMEVSIQTSVEAEAASIRVAAPAAPAAAQPIATLPAAPAAAVPLSALQPAAPAAPQQQQQSSQMLPSDPPPLDVYEYEEDEEERDSSSQPAHASQAQPVHEGVSTRRSANASVVEPARFTYWDKRKEQRRAKAAAVKQELRDESSMLAGTLPGAPAVAVRSAALFSAVVPANLPLEEPHTHAQATASPQRDKWQAAMDEEIASQESNESWTVVDRASVPAGKRVLPCRWVYKLKLGKDGSVDRFKARLVAKGFVQQSGIDYTETYAPVMSYRTLRVLLSLAAREDLEIKQFDVVTAFLHARITEELYMELPPGYTQDGKVARLNKAVYGIKQAPRAWNTEFHRALSSLGLRRLNTDACVYVLGKLILGIFVDDVIALYPHRIEAEWLAIKERLFSTFKAKDLGDAQYVLGMRISRNRAACLLFIDQEAFIHRVAARFNVHNGRKVSTPMDSRPSQRDQPATDAGKAEMADKPYRELIGALNYASISTRPDVSYAVHLLAQFAANPGPAHWTAALRVVRYLEATSALKLHLGGKVDGSPLVMVYSDADWAGDHDDRKSMTGVIVMMGQGTVAWTATKQKSVALSSMESEWYALAVGVQDAIWINSLLSELGVAAPSPLLINVDNEAVIAYGKHSAISTRTRHIGVRYHFIRDNVERKVVELHWVPTDQQLADILTKPLGAVLFKALRELLLSS
jgi:transposase InsO family protein